jgi:Asp-tRNA(Asn)/Glu-tRNA(Gln) amidotransferase A subunit family amidase
LEARSVDDALELFDVLMTNDLLARAGRESRQEKLRRYPRLSRDAGRLAAAVGVLLDVLERDEPLALEAVWEEIESKVSREDLRSAVAHLTEVALPPDADADGEWQRFGRAVRVGPGVRADAVRHDLVRSDRGRRGCPVRVA